MSATSRATGARCRACGCMATSRCAAHDGLYYILGRSDDTIKISGKRTGPAELEGMLIATGKRRGGRRVRRSASIKGSAIVCACVPMPGVEGATRPGRRAVAPPSSRAWARRTGRERILFVDDLPRTRNLKIMRRVLRAVFEDKDRRRPLGPGKPRGGRTAARKARDRVN